MSKKLIDYLNIVILKEPLVKINGFLYEDKILPNISTTCCLSTSSRIKSTLVLLSFLIFIFLNKIIVKKKKRYFIDLII